MAESMVHLLEHHAKDKKELVSTLCILFATELNPNGWSMSHLGKGPESFCMSKNGVQYHFRNGGKGTIRVMDHWFSTALRRPTTKLETRMAVIKWVRYIQKLHP